MPETILVVEDEPALRDTLSYNLKKDGFIVEAVGDGRTAVGLIPPGLAGVFAALFLWVSFSVS